MTATGKADDWDRAGRRAIIRWKAITTATAKLIRRFIAVGEIRRNKPIFLYSAAAPDITRSRGEVVQLMLHRCLMCRRGNLRRVKEVEIGYEAERVFPNHSYPNRTLQIIGDSPVYNLLLNGTLAYTGQNSNAVYFTLPNQAKVFSIGTVQYSWGLDDYAPTVATNVSSMRSHPVLTNNNAQVLATNILGCLVDGICQ